MSQDQNITSPPFPTEENGFMPPDLPSSPKPNQPSGFTNIPLVVSPPPKKRWGKGALVGSLLALLVLVGGLGVGVYLSQRKQQIVGQAWDGYGIDKTELQIRKQATENRPILVKPYSNFPTKDLYNGLVAKAPDADVISFREQSIGMEGTASMKYVDELGKTFVFSRIVGIPYPQTGLIRLWITKDDANFEPVGIVEFTYEPKIQEPVGYSVFVSEKDLRTYKRLIFSYDSSVDLAKPENLAITLNF